VIAPDPSVKLAVRVVLDPDSIRFGIEVKLVIPGRGITMIVVSAATGAVPLVPVTVSV